MDRLKAKAYEHEYMGVANLHSNMDRLKVSLHSKQRVQFSKFTFQYG